jgi:hypothetical protein
VIESEKTDQHLVERASSLLSGSNTQIGAILNKMRTYTPSRLHQDDLGSI